MYHVPLIFNVYMDAVMKNLKVGMGRAGVRFREEVRKWILHGPLYSRDFGGNPEGNGETFC